MSGFKAVVPNLINLLPAASRPAKLGELSHHHFSIRVLALRHWVRGFYCESGLEDAERPTKVFRHGSEFTRRATHLGWQRSISP